jgi:hypothetical protein
LGLPDYSVHRLSRADVGALQELFEHCMDFSLLVDGRAPAPHAADDMFDSGPPGRSLADKFVFGVVDRQGVLVGCLDGMRSYPDDTTWWIGLL